MRTGGHRITYDGESDGIYMRSDGMIAIGSTSGSADRKLYLNGSLYARDNDRAEGTTTGIGHEFSGKGIHGSYPHILWVATGGVAQDDASYPKCVGINVQLPVWNSPEGKYEWIRFMNVYGGVDGYIGNAESGIRGIEIWGLNQTHSPSDQRLKENIVDTKSGLNDIMKVRVRDFNFIKNEKLRTGMIAQELNEVMGSFVDKPDTGYWSIQYDRFIPILIKAIQDLKKEVDSLKN